MTEPPAPDSAEEPTTDAGGPIAAPGTDAAAPAVQPDRIDPEGPMASALRSAGTTDDEIEAAAAHGLLGFLYVERMVMPDRLDRGIDEVSAETGLSADLVRQLRRSLGFVESDQVDRRYGDVDVEILGSIGELLGSDLVDPELVIQMARVIGSSMSRIAASLLDALGPDATSALDGDGTDADRFAEIAPQLFPMLLRVIDYVWSRHLQAEARARMNRDLAGTGSDAQVVGFADLVGFTALSQQIGPRELAEVVDRFEAIAYDIVGRHGGRVVKMIGDEVMFTVEGEAAGAEIALAMAETFRDDHHLADVRVGLAAGPVLQREADLFGPVVNLASRIVSLAYPGTVLCDSAVHEALADDEAFEWRSLGNKSLKNIGKVAVHVVRRQDGPHEPDDGSDREARRAERRRRRAAEAAGRKAKDAGPAPSPDTRA